MTRPVTPSRARLLTAAIGALALASIVTGCSGGEGASATATTAVTAAPDLVGAWEGTYAFPTPDGGLFPSPLRLVVERQDQGALWGYEEFEDSGQTIRIPLTGSLDADNGGFGLAATGLTVEGTMTGLDEMNVRFFKVTDPATSFQLELRRVTEWAAAPGRPPAPA